MLKLNNLKAPFGSNHSKKRKGKGIGSGLGKTAGKGHKGQRARSGGKTVFGFEGGQMPLHRKLPKVGFNAQNTVNKILVNVTELSKFKGMDVTAKQLASKSKTPNPRGHIRLFGSRIPKDLPKSLEVHHVAPLTKKLLEEKGVKISLVKKLNGRIGTRKSV